MSEKSLFLVCKFWGIFCTVRFKEDEKGSTVMDHIISKGQTSHRAIPARVAKKAVSFITENQQT